MSTQILLKKSEDFSLLYDKIGKLEEENLLIKKQLQDLKNISITSLLETEFDGRDVQMFSHRISSLTAANFTLVAEKNGFVKSIFLTKIINQALNKFL